MVIEKYIWGVLGEMARRYWKAEEKLALIKEIENGGHVIEACRQYSVDPTMFYRWKEAYNAFGMDGLRLRSTQIQPGFRKLKKENEHLKRIIAKKELEVAMLQEAYKKRGESVDL